MNTTTGDPGQPGGPPGPRPAYPPCLPVHTVMRLLAADGCEKISVTAENSGRAVKAASDVMRALGLIPDREGAVTRPATKPSADQRRAVERARDFLQAAAAGPRTLAARLDAGAVEDTALFYATDGFGSAIVQLRDLLAILDELAPAEPASGTAGGTR